ncbi:MAG TPA: hypothetical protein PKK61_04760 [Defluviitaleaceae bacterium]|nr:hypothetical protein [Defluviitaleaceae bacterium]
MFFESFMIRFDLLFIFLRFIFIEAFIFSILLFTISKLKKKSIGEFKVFLKDIAYFFIARSAAYLIIAVALDIFNLLAMFIFRKVVFEYYLMIPIEIGIIVLPGLFITSAFTIVALIASNLGKEFFKKLKIWILGGTSLIIGICFSFMAVISLL